MTALALSWYGGQLETPFHFFDDLAEWCQVDKWGHFFAAFQLAALVARLLGWTGMDKSMAASRAAGVSFLMMAGVEVGDGFSTGYGASVYDLLANGAGVLAWFLQSKFLGRVRWLPKFSFHFTQWAMQRPSLLGDHWLSQIIKDYNGQTYWVTVPVLKGRLSWLCLSVGYGAEGMIHGRLEENLASGLTTHRRILLSLDVAPNGPFFDTGPGRWIMPLLHGCKLPAPTLEISENGIRFHWIYF